MKPALIVLCICMAIFGVSSQPGACPHYSANTTAGECYYTCTVGTCGPGEECCTTACGGTACIPTRNNTGVPWWCPPGSPTIACYVNPCTVVTCPAIPLARCVNDDPCEKACTANFYLGDNKVPYFLCHLIID